MITLTLPMAPTANNSYATFKGRRIISRATIAFRKAVAAIVNQPPRPAPLTARLSVFIEVYPRDKRKQDIDNRVKPVLDALTHAGIWLDDSQVDHLHISRGPVVKDGKLIVTIRELSPVEKFSTEIQSRSPPI